MTHAAFNAGLVYEAAQAAIATRDRIHADVTRLGQIADLAHGAATVMGNDAVMYLSAEDYPLVHGHFKSALRAGRGS